MPPRRRRARPRKTSVTSASTVSVSGLKTLAGSLSSSGKSDLQKRLKEAAQVVADRAKEISAGFSTRIPRSIRVTAGSTTATITAQGNIAPNAYPFEQPDGPVRHPLFGNREHWYAQPYRPFLGKAADEKAGEAADKLAEVIDDWAKEQGYK